MNYTDEAIDLLKKFSSGVDCPQWGEVPIERRMFHPKCKEIAEKMGKKEIDEEVVKEYILKEHNPITVQFGCSRNSTADEIRNCMVRATEKKGELVCVHGRAVVFPITKEEAEFLKKEEERLLKGL